MWWRCLASFQDVYQDVISEDQDKKMEVLPEHLVHKSLEHGVGTDQAIWHDPVFIVASKGHKRGLLFVPTHDPVMQKRGIPERAATQYEINDMS